MDYNKIILSGRLGQDAELQYTSSGYAVLNFSLANSPNYKDKDKVSFFRCALWGKRAESMKDYLTKGTAIIMDGQVVIDKYQKQNGDIAYITKINVGDLQFAQSNKIDPSSKPKAAPQKQPSGGGWHQDNPQAKQADEDPDKDLPFPAIDDEDIPF